jgi:hypothetical protein
LYGPLLEIEWILGRIIIVYFHTVDIGTSHSIEIVWIYYGFSGAIANFIMDFTLFPVYRK